jgi:hypothetical protein
MHVDIKAKVFVGLYTILDVDSALELANALHRVLKSPEMAELWDALVSIIKALANGVRRIQPCNLYKPLFKNYQLIYQYQL